MSLHKNWKVIILLVVMAAQGFVINHLTRGCGDNVIWQIATEVPEPGSILFLAFGSLWLRNQSRKNHKHIKH